jgi:hypothetical protein
MAYMGNLPIPDCIGFEAKPNLIVPLYIQVELHRFRDETGQLVLNRRPRPLSIVSGSEVVLQSDPALLAQYDFMKRNRKKNNFFSILTILPKCFIRILLLKTAILIM